jgi:ribonuclease HI
MESITVYVSGVSLSNPGPAGVGVVVIDKETKTETFQAIGNADINFASYYALMIAMENLVETYGEETKTRRFDFRMDNKIVVDQLLNKKEIKEPGLVPFFIAIHNHQVTNFPQVTFTLIKENKVATTLANKAFSNK